ncbi:dienelactone hydrolase [Geomonas sp. Red276]
MKRWLFALLLVLAARNVEAKMITKTVDYRQGDTTLEGFLAYDDSFKGKRPGVLVIHEWTGVTSYEKGRCEQLAKLGYVAFAADIYGKGVRPSNPQEAAREAGKYRSEDRSLLRARAAAGLEKLAGFKNVNPKKLAAMGYCFGGTATLELARSGADLLGTVSFHGGLDTPNPADAKNIKGRVLALHGGDDPLVPADKVAAFQKEMRDAKVDWEMNIYGGAVHSFTNPKSGNDPSKGVAYNEKADHRSWEAMKLFFKEIFK